MSNIDKRALREVAKNAKELGNISRYTKAMVARLEFKEAATPDVVLALLDELEAAESGFPPLAVERLMREKESLRERVAELEMKKVKIKLPESFYPDGDIDCPLVINEYQIIEAIVAAGCKPIAVCPRCKCELDLTHKPDGAHFCHPAAAGKGE